MVDRAFMFTPWITVFTNSQKRGIQRETIFKEPQRVCLVNEKPVKDCSPLKVSSDQQKVKHQGQAGWVFGLLLHTSVLCVCAWTCPLAFVRVCGLLKSTLCSQCFLVLSQSQSSVTGDKARLLRRQEEMELGSLERATHNCIYISLEGSSATLNLCALISEVSACAERAVACLDSSPYRHKQKRRTAF